VPPCGDALLDRDDLRRRPVVELAGEYPVGVDSPLRHRRANIKFQPNATTSDPIELFASIGNRSPEPALYVATRIYLDAVFSFMMVAEIVGGSLFGSMALIADRLHMSTHATAPSTRTDR
jgi:hypothetical protein